MKKRIMIFCLCLIVLSTTACKKKTETDIKQNDPIEQNENGDNKNNQLGNQKGNDDVDEKEKEEAYEATQKEVDLLFSNSSFFEVKLLDDPPEDSNASIPNLIVPSSSDDVYYIGQYQDSFFITCMVIESPKLNFLGISPGDSKDIIADKLKDTTFCYDNTREEQDYDVIQYNTSLLSLSFEVSKDGIINNICASVFDPYIPDDKRIDF